jgi:hypothetical protein
MLEYGWIAVAVLGGVTAIIAIVVLIASRVRGGR